MSQQLTTFLIKKIKTLYQFFVSLTGITMKNEEINKQRTTSIEEGLSYLI